MRQNTFAVSLAVVAVALVSVQAAFAEAPQIRFTVADQAAARSAVLRAGDLGAGWKGGAKKPDLSGDAPCPGVEPKQRDLVLTGAAESAFRHTGGAFITSSAHLLETEAMVRLDWQRTAVIDAAGVRCLRSVLADSGGKLVSFKRLAFPKVAQYTLRYRAIVEGAKGRVVMDFVAFGAGRVELELMVVASVAERGSLDAAELQLARLMLSRAS